MVSGWVITLGLINAYVILLVWLVRSGRMEKYNLSLLLGFILMIRTQRGRDLIDKIARPKKFWHIWGNVGIAVVAITMLGMTLLMLIVIPTLLAPDSEVEPLSAKEIFVIPGVNPIVPLWYGVIALIVTLIVHEGGHGILARAHNMRLKSLGLLYAIVPIGAFVEPDEEDMAKSTRKARMQVFAAGPGVNFATAAIVMLAFTGMMSGVAMHDGVAIAQVSQDHPAFNAGIMGGDVLVGAMIGGNSTQFAGWPAFTEFMADREPNEEVTFQLRDGSDATVTLTSRWDTFSESQQEALVKADPEMAENMTKAAFLGVFPFTPEMGATVTSPFAKFQHFLVFLYLPLGEVNDAPYLSVYMPSFYDAPFAPDIFWPLATAVFWIFWMNLMVGLFNALPMTPLDGGHFFRDAVGGLVDRIRPGSEEADRMKLTGRITGGMSLLIFAAILIQIFGPHLR